MFLLKWWWFDCHFTYVFRQFLALWIIWLESVASDKMLLPVNVLIDHGCNKIFYVKSSSYLSNYMLTRLNVDKIECWNHYLYNYAATTICVVPSWTLSNEEKTLQLDWTQQIPLKRHHHTTPSHHYGNGSVIFSHVKATIKLISFPGFHFWHI